MAEEEEEEGRGAVVRDASAGLSCTTPRENLPLSPPRPGAAVESSINQPGENKTFSFHETARSRTPRTRCARGHITVQFEITSFGFKTEYRLCARSSPFVLRYFRLYDRARE